MWIHVMGRTPNKATKADAPQSAWEDPLCSMANLNTAFLDEVTVALRMMQNHEQFRDLATEPCTKKARRGDDAVDADMGNVQAFFKLEDFRSAMKERAGYLPMRMQCMVAGLVSYHGARRSLQLCCHLENGGDLLLNPSPILWYEYCDDSRQVLQPA